MQAIKRQSQGTYKLGPGTLYDNLKKLMDQGLVVDAPQAERNKNESRRLYRLTADGRAALAAEILRLEGVIADARPHLKSRRPRKA
jgi:DNA-binding PadR family transcriptional regulator